MFSTRPQASVSGAALVNEVRASGQVSAFVRAMLAKSHEGAQGTKMGWILLVDDDVEVRETVAHLLRDEGYVVVEASDGHHALQAILTTPKRPSLVLLDLMMPKMRGEAFLEILRDIGLLHELEIVVVTAGMAKAVSGSRAILHKPFGLMELLDVVARYCAPATPGSRP